MKRILILLLALVLLCAGGLLLVPGWLRPRLESAGSALCKDCRLEIGALGWHFFPLGLTARDVHFRSGDIRDSALLVRVSRALVPVPFSNIFRRGPFRIGEVDLSGVNVTVHEGDARVPPAPSASAAGKGFEVAGIVVRDASFTYRKDSPAGSAWLRLAPVSAAGGRFGTSEALRDQPLEARAVARLENSGDVELVVRAKYFESPPWADVDLHLTGQRLAEVNEYFRPEEGVTLAGRLVDAHGLVSVRGRRADGTVHARFAGLDLHFHANRHRGGISALLDNLAVRVKLKGANLADPPGEASKAVVTARHERESVVSFVLRTLREAALRVASR